MALFLPKFLVNLVVSGFSFLDHYLKFLLKPLALHFVVRASKKADEKETEMSDERSA